MESGVMNMAFTRDTFITNIKFMYKCFSKQDKEDLGNFTTGYSNSFGNTKLGLREQWWHIDLIYVGRWKLKNPTTGNTWSGFIASRTLGFNRWKL